MAHDHGHLHGHADHHGIGGHSHAPADFGKAFAIGTGLNLLYVVVEAVFGFLAGSMALLADAGHNLSDVLGLSARLGRRVARRAAADPARAPTATSAARSWPRSPTR